MRNLIVFSVVLMGIGCSSSGSRDGQDGTFDPNDSAVDSGPLADAARVVDADRLRDVSRMRASDSGLLPDAAATTDSGQVDRGQIEIVRVGDVLPLHRVERGRAVFADVMLVGADRVLVTYQLAGFEEFCQGYRVRDTNCDA